MIKIHYRDREREKTSAFDSRQLHLIVMPTEKCNLRCIYCYNNFKIGKMKDEVLSGIKSLISQKVPALDELRISWFGGEPLLAKGIILDIHEHIAQLKRHYRGLNTYGSITTNGYLLSRAMISELVCTGVSQFQITLDGPKAEHDRKRILASGNGTYEKIWGNIESMLQSSLQFRLLLRIHYSMECISETQDLLTSIERNHSHDNRLKILLKSIEKLGGKTCSSIGYVQRDEQHKIENKLKNSVPGLNVATRNDIEDTYICYSAKKNTLVIRSDGRISKCTVAFDDDANTIGKIGKDGVMQIDEKKHGVWTSVFSAESESALSCPYSYIRNKR